MSDSCNRLAAWLQRVPTPADRSLPPDDLLAHAQSCRRCQGMLLLLVTDLAGPQAGSISVDCSLVEEHIPAMVDHERRFGPAAAARAFPDVWWHALICPRCAEIYSSLLELADLPELSWRSTVVAPRPQVARLLQLRFQPRVVPQLAATRSQLGVAWGARQPDVFIADQEDDEGEVRLYFRRLPQDEYALVVRTEPAMVGTAQLTIADQTLSQPLDSAGAAVFAGLADVLLGATGFVEVSVRAEPGTSDK